MGQCCVSQKLAELQQVCNKSCISNLLSNEDYQEFLAFADIETFTAESVLKFGKSKVVLVINGQILAVVSKAKKSKHQNVEDRRFPKRLCHCGYTKRGMLSSCLSLN